jgi:2-polyprenyl-6-methoxyphenol hydroxylase-like FAD-dependent oxidoreductase
MARRVLISGAGVAGPTLAYWLARYGWTPTIVEKAPALRRGGYVVDFWGAGFEVADRMGLRSEILSKGYSIRELREVARDGTAVANVPVRAITRVLSDSFTSVPRTDLAAAIVGAIPGDVEIICGDSVLRIDQTDAQVDVAFESRSTRTFDLVVGADGLHSRIRELVFGPADRFEQYLGIKVAAFEAEGYRPRDELTFVMHTEVGCQISRFTMRNNRTMFLFIFADADPNGPADMAGQKAVLREHFGHRGWECPQILRALDDAADLYFDRVSQVHMSPAEGLWTKGRTTLVGDAAFCVSLLGGQGSGLAMTAAYILAGELHRANGDYREAFARYQRLFAPFVAAKQRAARRLLGSFAPRSPLSLFVRNRVFQLLGVPGVANLVAGRGFKDAIALPNY